MKNFLVHDQSGKILRHGKCQNSTFNLQAKENETVLNQKSKGRYFKIVDGIQIPMTPGEIEADNLTPPEILEDEKIKRIKNKDWNDMMSKLDDLANRVESLENPI